MANTEKTYRGNCHCGTFVYELTCPEITSVTACNCNLCAKKDLIFVWPNAQSGEAFRVVKGSLDDLVEYAPESSNHASKFCGICATPVLSIFKGAEAEADTAINVHSLQNVDTWELKRVVRDLDEHSKAQTYLPAEHKGPSPSAQIDGGQLYTGACHCRALTVAVISKPLDETFEDRIVVCDCSSCERNGAMWRYAKQDEVVLTADEDADLGKYTFNMGLALKTFCKRCGVTMTNELSPGFREGEDATNKLSGMMLEVRALLLAHRPVNLRVLEGLDLSKLKPYYFKGADLIQPPYVNP